MPIIIPDDILRKAKITEKDFLIDIAVYLYDKKRLSIGQAKRLAGLNQLEFQKALADRGVYLNYDVEEFHKDLKTLGIEPR